MTAADFLDSENWHGSYYELAVALGSPTDPDAGVRIQRARTAIWQDPRLDGCYLDRWARPEEQARLSPDLSNVELTSPIYGRALLPNGATVVCAMHVVREEGDDALDWIAICLPTGALERAIPELDHPLHQDGSRSWREPIDDWLHRVADRIGQAASLAFGLVGEEVSGLSAINRNGDPLPEVQSRTSILIPSGDTVTWLRPHSW
jgi:hypothetical protein